MKIWEGALNTLKSGQSFTRGNDNEELWSKLRISYDHLDKKHQNMFLDIACVLGGLKISTIVEHGVGIIYTQNLDYTTYNIDI